MRRRIAALALVVAFCAGVVVTRAVWQGRAALDDGDRAFSAGDNEEAIRWWRRAARWYVPLAPHVVDAYDRLQALAGEAEAKGDVATALAAWQAVRGSILATRSFYVPHEERLDPANKHIAGLLARMDGAPDAGKTEAERAAWHYRVLDRDEAPDVGWTLLALAGFLTWLGGGALFAWRGISADDKLVPRAATTAGLLVASGLVLWLLGLYQA
ncbi:MAG TPA: hypothetical protein VKB80_33430 [Kofleriaceae bacterium]|nr:hypothetical protein [Kofleriaceae bacterium]